MTGFAEDNAPAYEPPMTKAAFLHWVQRQERKYEWKDGSIVQMANVTKAHARTVSNFVTSLSNRLDVDVWSVYASDLDVETEGTVRYPDVIVEVFDADGRSRRSLKPIVLVEVLSVSTSSTDFIDKLAEYLTFDSLEAYVVASQDEPILWVWQRDATSRVFPAKPQQIDGRDQSLVLTTLKITLPLAELYRGIATV